MYRATGVLCDCGSLLVPGEKYCEVHLAARKHRRHAREAKDNRLKAQLDFTACMRRGCFAPVQEGGRLCAAHEAKRSRP